jgi:hypothetical protein
MAAAVKCLEAGLKLGHQRHQHRQRISHPLSSPYSCSSIQPSTSLPPNPTGWSPDSMKADSLRRPLATAASIAYSLPPTLGTSRPRRTIDSRIRTIEANMGRRSIDALIGLEDHRR